eukprot:c26015_g1_i1.p1 GENE.c26015_g1_i1~~c26015_g1_i1.p1  ORF type:complete len:424 (-),score=100.58 c26015_g1_i1:210-1481(-)
MGSVCSAIQAACCACQAFQTCLSCCRCGKSSTRARAHYFLMFVLSAIVTWVLKGYGYDGLIHVGDMKECDNEQCTGTGAVLRITLAMVLLSSALAVLVLGVNSSENPRAVFQNDFFALKWLVLAISTVGCLFVSNQTAIEYGYVAAVGGGLFLFLGIVLLLEFAYSWNDTWVERLDSTGEKFWAYLIVGCSTVMYGLSIAVWVLLLKFFGGDDCKHTNAFVSITIVLSVISTCITLPDKVQNGALLPCSVVVLYCSYICASAVLSIPQDDTSKCVALHQSVSDQMQQLMRAAGMILTIFCVGYATIRAASSGQDFTGGQVRPDPKALMSDQGTEVKAEADKDEEDKTQYNYAFFQIVYSLGAMYLAMVLIDWQIEFKVHSGSKFGDMSTWATVWIKIASQWATFAIYIWSLIAPFVCTGRDFS